MDFGGKFGKDEGLPYGVMIFFPMSSVAFLNSSVYDRFLS